MPLVKSDMLPTTLLENPCTPVTMEPANAEPGKVGMDGLAPPVDGADGRAVEVAALP